MDNSIIRHILLIKFKNDTAQSQIDTLRALFESIPDKVEGVVSVEWGMNNSPENKNQGFTHSVFMTFANEQGRQSYLPHREHKSLQKVFAPLLEDIIVFDYQVAESKFTSAQ